MQLGALHSPGIGTGTASMWLGTARPGDWDQYWRCLHRARCCILTRTSTLVLGPSYQDSPPGPETITGTFSVEVGTALLGPRPESAHLPGAGHWVALGLAASRAWGWHCPEPAVVSPSRAGLGFTPVLWGQDQLKHHQQGTGALHCTASASTSTSIVWAGHHRGTGTSTTSIGLDAAPSRPAPSPSAPGPHPALPGLGTSPTAHKWAQHQ